MEYPKFKVTVRCMTYNQSKYITDAMNGFTMQQTSFPFVCAIVDDASTDGEQEVIRKYVEDNFDFSEGSVAFLKETDYAHITYAQHKTNKNCYFAVLYLKENHYSQKKPKMGYLSEWRDMCEYEAMCEGDDYWIVPNKLQMQADLLDSDHMIGMVRTDADKLIQSNGIVEKAFMSKPPYNKIKDTYIDYLINMWFNAPLTHMKRIGAYSNVCLKSDYTAGNLPVFLTILKNGYSINYIPEVTSVYRVLEKSASHHISLENKYNFFKGIRAIQIDYSQDQSFDIKLRIFLIIQLERIKFYLHFMLKFMKIFSHDAKNDYKRMFRNRN